MSDSGWYARALLIENKGVSEGFMGVVEDVAGRSREGMRMWRDDGGERVDDGGL